LKWSNKSVLVTGGTGLVGSRIARRLAEKDAKVRILDNLSAYPFNQIEHFGVGGLDGVEIVKGDITSNELLEKTITGTDVVFHLAAFADVAAAIWNPQEDFNSNVRGTFNLLSFARKCGVKRFVFASSASVYGNPPWGRRNEPPVFSEKMRTEPISTYANSKLWGENECLLFHNLYSLKTTSLRYFSIYGSPQVPKKRSQSWVVAIFAMKLLTGKKLTIFGDGLQVRDFVHVNDVAEGTIKAAECDSTVGKIVNLGRGIPTSILDVARGMSKLAGASENLEFLPRPTGDPLGGYADTRLMKETLDWQPAIEFNEGMKEYWEWASTHKEVIPSWM
jgi:nucleoside-diphosphate-sugar epimerase